MERFSFLVNGIRFVVIGDFQGADRPGFTISEEANRASTEPILQFVQANDAQNLLNQVSKLPRFSGLTDWSHTGRA
jgi:hypothetical protein